MWLVVIRDRVAASDRNETMGSRLPDGTDAHGPGRFGTESSKKSSPGLAPGSTSESTSTWVAGAAAGPDSASPPPDAVESTRGSGVTSIEIKPESAKSALPSTTRRADADATTEIDAGRISNRSAAGTTDVANGNGWDGVERRRYQTPEVDEIRHRLRSRLEHRRLAWRVAADAAVFMLAVLAAFGACWIVTVVVNNAMFPEEFAMAVKVGGMGLSATAAVYGAIVSWKIGWRSFFVGWIVGGKLFLAAAVMGLA